MASIKEILGYPDKCPVKQLQAHVVEVYPPEQRAGKPIQTLVLKDATGEIKVTAWEHSDLSFYKGKDVVMTEGPKGGFSVNIYKDKTSLNFSRSCQFQLVHIASTPAVVDGSADNIKVNVTEVAGRTNPINGQTVGMAINNACQNLTARGENLDPKAIYVMASAIVKVARHIESGHLHQTAEEKAANATETAPAPKPAVKDKEEEDVPF